MITRAPFSAADRDYRDRVELREAFDPLLGNWAGVEEQAASPWAPAATARAMIVFKLDLAGTAVVQDYRQVRSDGAEFTAHGVYVGLPDGRLRWWLFDSYGQPPEPAEGSWIDGALVLAKTTPRGTARHTFSLLGDKLVYRIETRLGEDAYFSQFLVGAYNRFSGH